MQTSSLNPVHAARLDDPVPRNNGPVLLISQIIRFVMTLAAEDKLAALYITAREMVPLCNTLEEMG